MNIFQFFSSFVLYTSSERCSYAAPKAPNHLFFSEANKQKQTSKTTKRTEWEFCRCITAIFKTLPLYEIFNNISCNINCHGNCDCCCSDISSGRNGASDREMQMQAGFCCWGFCSVLFFLQKCTTWL